MQAPLERAMNNTDEEVGKVMGDNFTSHRNLARAWSDHVIRDFHRTCYFW
jgi:hypothetical protein